MLVVCSLRFEVVEYMNVVNIVDIGNCKDAVDIVRVSLSMMVMIVQYTYLPATYLLLSYSLTYLPTTLSV